MRPIIILFAKAPVPGRVKTRLIPPLTPESAAALHHAFAQDMIERLQALRPLADIELHTDIPTSAWSSPELPRLLQHEGDLGLKMFQALRAALAFGRPRAAIVGCDAPTLPLRHLELLLRSPADVALGPATDGGYYAIACGRVKPEMFQGVSWSTAETLTQTVAGARNCGLTVALGDSWYDIDTVGDLDRLRASSVLPRHTARFLNGKIDPEFLA